MTERSTEIKNLAAALAKAQAAIQPAVKDKTNPAFRSRYADLASVWDACRKPLTDNGLSIVQMPVDAEAGRVALETMLLHVSGEFISSTVSTALVKADPQGVGSALTYLRRYALSAVVGVVADEDDDGNRASQPAQRNGGAAYEAPAQQQAQPATNGNGHGAPGKASEKQIKMLFAIWNKAGFNGKLSDWIAESYGCGVDDLNVKQASAAIEALQKDEPAN